MRNKWNRARTGRLQAVVIVLAAVVLFAAIVLIVYWSSFGPRVLERRDPSQIYWEPPESLDEVYQAPVEAVPPGTVLPIPAVSEPWEFDIGLLGRLGPETPVPHAPEFLFRPPIGYREKRMGPRSETPDWAGPTRPDRSTHSISVAAGGRKSSWTYDEQGLRSVADDWLAGFSGYDDLKRTEPEKGTINGLSAMRFFYSGRRGIKEYKVRGMFYFIFDGPVVIWCHSEDREEYSNETLRLAEAAVFALRKTSQVLGADFEPSMQKDSRPDRAIR